jgi:hypothetical protein
LRCLLALSSLCWFWTGCAWGYGPGRLLHPYGAPDAEGSRRCWHLGEEQREHVHVLLVNGVDPANLCNFHGLRDYVRDLGFVQTSYYQMWETAAVKDHIRDIRASDPRGRIVLIGYSAGCNVVCGIAQSLKEESCAIDVLVYVGGDMLRNTAAYRPDNCHKIVNVRAWGVVFLAGGIINGAELDGANNHYLGPIRHASVPSNQRLLQLLTEELYQLARDVPVEEIPATFKPE